MGTYEKYAWDISGEAARNAGASYERYFVPSIGRPFARLVIEAPDLRQGERVLDVACGTGVAARLAAERVAPTGTVVGRPESGNAGGGPKHFRRRRVAARGG
jgi:SAM-dependent methyltransferase